MNDPNPIRDEMEKDPFDLAVLRTNFKLYFADEESRKILKTTLNAVIQHADDAHSMASVLALIPGGLGALKKLALSTVGLV